MFHLARSFNQLLNNWDVSNVEDMFGMFWNARSFNQPLNDWNVSKVKNIAPARARARAVPRHDAAVAVG